MEDKKETEKVDEYEKDKQAEDKATSFIHLFCYKLCSDIQKKQFAVQGQRISYLTVPSV